MIQDWYPRRAPEYVTPNSILCFPTLSFGLTAEQESALFDSLRSAGAVILGLRTFFRLRDSEEEQQRACRANPRARLRCSCRCSRLARA